MFHHVFVRHRTALLVFGSLSLLLIGLGTAPGATGSAADSEKLQTLLEERREVLDQAVQLAMEAYQKGEADIGSVFALQRQLLDADLELAEDREQHLELLRQHVENARVFAKSAEARYRTGVAPQSEVFTARADRLAAQIELERAKLDDKAL